MAGWAGSGGGSGGGGSTDSPSAKRGSGGGSAGGGGSSGSGAYNRALAAHTPSGTGQWASYNPLRQGPGIWVDSSIARADRIAKTYERVTHSHSRWVWRGIDDLAWSARQWHQALKELWGDHSLWEGGVFCALLRTAEPLASCGGGGRNPGGAFDGAMVPMSSNGSFGRSVREWRWKLDLTEGPERTRRRLLRNYRFFETYDVMERRPGGGDEEEPRRSSKVLPAITAGDTAAAAGSGGQGGTNGGSGGGDTAAASPAAAEPLLDLSHTDDAANAAATDATASAAGGAAGSRARKGKDPAAFPGVSPDIDITLLLKRVSAEVGSRGKARAQRLGLFDEDDDAADTLGEMELDLDGDVEPEDPSGVGIGSSSDRGGGGAGSAAAARHGGDDSDGASDGTASPSPG
ncbi:unnamed protein product, partial [Phaeothamnion confervicola]